MFYNISNIRPLVDKVSNFWSMGYRQWKKCCVYHQLVTVNWLPFTVFRGKRLTVKNGSLPQLTVRCEYWPPYREYCLKKNYCLFSVRINFTNTVETLRQLFFAVKLNSKGYSDMFYTAKIFCPTTMCICMSIF